MAKIPVIAKIMIGLKFCREELRESKGKGLGRIDGI